MHENTQEHLREAKCTLGQNSVVTLTQKIEESPSDLTQGLAPKRTLHTLSVTVNNGEDVEGREASAGDPETSLRLLAAWSPSII
jgi:hypothetical protein